MKNQTSTLVFDRERAIAYDQGMAKFAPIYESLYFLIRVVLADLPANARVLCVGVGTGKELINLAQAFPQCHFTAVDPAVPMLDICRQHAEECGITSRCTFHEGYLDSLPPADLFDAATCLMVSMSFMQREDRRNFFSQIAARLRPGGYLIDSDHSSETNQDLFELWLRMLKHSEMPAEQIEFIRASFGRSVALIPPKEIESIIASSGFDPPVLFFQNLLMHAWYAKRTQ